MTTRAHALLVAIVLAAGPAFGAANDINLLGLVHPAAARETPCTSDGKFACDTVGFQALARELGVVMTPTSLQPAETTGQAGFDFGLDYTFHTMRFDESYWRNTRQDPSVPLLMSLGARVRKGFVLPVPLTSEVELGSQWLIDSNLLDLGANIRVALNEGFRWVPDLAVQAGINRMVGNKDLDLLTVTAGGQVSKGFGIQGSFNVCPFVGYQSIWVNASSRILDTDATDATNVNDNAVFLQTPLQANRLDRVSVGLRFSYAVVTLTGGLDMDFVPPKGAAAGADPEMLLQYSLRAGVAF